MPAASTITRLYVAVFGRQPTSATEEAVIRMEHLFGLAQDDMLARLLVVLLHAADRFDDAVTARATEERAILEELGYTLNRMKGLTYELDRVRALVNGIPEPRRQLSDRALIPVYPSRWPVMTYLAHAWRFRTGVLEVDERIEAARSDMYGIGMILLALLFLIFIAGVGFGRLP